MTATHLTYAEALARAAQRNAPTKPAKSTPHVASHVARKAYVRANDPILAEAGKVPGEMLG